MAVAAETLAARITVPEAPVVDSTVRLGNQMVAERLVAGLKTAAERLVKAAWLEAWVKVAVEVSIMTPAVAAVTMAAAAVMPLVVVVVVATLVACGTGPHRLAGAPVTGRLLSAGVNNRSIRLALGV